MRNLLLLSYSENWTKSMLNLCLKAGIMNTNVHIVISAFVSLASFVVVHFVIVVLFLMFYFIGFVSQNSISIVIFIVLNLIKVYCFRVLQVGMR
jgi:hypothetical protein